MADTEGLNGIGMQGLTLLLSTHFRGGISARDYMPQYYLARTFAFIIALLSS